MEIEQTGILLLVGISGSGKSTWARRHFDAYQVLSSDHFRGLVAGSEEDQTASGDAFWLMHEALHLRLQRGLFTVIDATNLEDHHRRYYLQAGLLYDQPVRAVVFHTPVQTCLERNARRPERQVPEPALLRQHETLISGIEHIDREGFTEVLHVYPGRDRPVK